MTESNSSRAKWYASYTKSLTEKKVFDELHQPRDGKIRPSGPASAGIHVDGVPGGDIIFIIDEL